MDNFTLKYFLCLDLYFRCVQCEDAESMRRNIKSKMSHYQQASGVLLYLYSIILTKVSVF